MLRDLINDHCEVECVNRFFPCAANCGKFVQLATLDHHNSEVCAKRKILCPHGCGEEFRAEALPLHTEFCMEQPLSCTYESPVCTRKLSSWVHGDVFAGCGYMLSCEAHKETPLNYCAKTNRVCRPPPCTVVVLPHVGSSRAVLLRSSTRLATSFG